jgi:hypothetical protein
MVVLVVAAVLAVVGLRQVNLSLLDQRLVDIREMPDSVVSAGFSLSTDRELEIDVSSVDQVRYVEGSSNSVLANLRSVFLVDASTKETVWDMRDESVRRGADGVLAYQGTIALPEGQYILTCSVTEERRRQQDGSWVSWLDGERGVQGTDTESDRASYDFHITVTGKGRQLSSSEVIAAIKAPVEPVTRADRETSSRTARTRTRGNDAGDNRRGGLLADLTRLGDDEAKFGQFSLRQRTEVRVYAVGEGMNGEMYDYGWIVNTANGRTVWEMRYEDTERAGGNGKNRLVDTTLSLRRGNYVAYFVTDASHSYDDWNARAPENEEGWGIRVTEANGMGVREDDQWTAIAQLTEIRDDVRRRAYFTLERRSRVRVYALGEGDRNEMYDYAWVEDADTRTKIWEMTYRSSEHAGGASKNRVVDSTGWLPAGKYVLRYRSDESHSPESWNADPPRDRRNYGVTVFVER